MKASPRAKRVMLAIAAFLLFSVILCCCVMLAASSENCTVIKDTRWATDTTPINLFYIGLKGVCSEEGKFQLFEMHTDKDLANCKGASEAATTFTVLLFLCSISAFVMCLWRLGGNHTWWKVCIFVSLAGVLFDIIALGTFLGQCSSYHENNLELSVGNDLGIYSIFALIAVSLL